jgi:hypothetical protein
VWVILAMGVGLMIVNIVTMVNMYSVIETMWLEIQQVNLDRELRASGKLISRCLQHGESLKDLVDTLSQDNVIGQMANYLHKNMEDIILGKQPDKKQRMLSTDPYAMKE